MQSLDPEKIEAELQSLLKVDALYSSGMYWRINAIIVAIHAGRYDIAQSDIETIPISEKLDEIKTLLGNIESHFKGA